MNTHTHKKLVSAGVVCGFALSILLAVTNLTAQDSSSASSANKGDFARGAQIWGETCVRCHDMRKPDEKDDARWSLIITHMRTRAGLTGQDARDVLAFLQASNK